MINYQTSTIGINIIKKFEGCSLTPYQCIAGHMTIGYGHVILKGENFVKISRSKAEAILLKDLKKFENLVIKLINVPLQQNQFDALVSFTYNLGGAALQRSTLRQKINYQSYSEAQAEFLKWTYAGTKKIKGLLERRLTESLLFAGYITV